MSCGEIIGRCEKQDSKLTKVVIKRMPKPGDKELLMKLCSSLHYNSIVSILDLSHIKIDNSICNVVGKMLCVNEGLRYLHVSLSGCRMDDEGATSIVQGLGNNSTLTELNLSRNKIGVNGCQAIGQMLLANKGLQKLRLGHCNIDRGIEFITQELHHNSTLTELHLTRNKIGMNGCQAIGQMLLVNKGLHKLFLGYCSIDNEGVIAICDGLHQNEFIGTLNLRNNDIDDKGCLAIEQMFKVNRSLTQVELCDNYKIGVEGVERIVSGLQQKYYLTQILLNYHTKKDFFDFYVTLNKAGLGLLLKSPTTTTDMLVESLISACRLIEHSRETTDKKAMRIMSCYFYLLTKKPKLCEKTPSS